MENSAGKSWWSLIAGRIPGRTDNEIKNYWNTYLKKKIAKDTFDSQPSSVTSPTPTSKEISSLEKVSRRMREESNMVQAKVYPCTKGLPNIEEGSLPAAPLDLGLCRELCFDDSGMGEVYSVSKLEESEELNYFFAVFERDFLILDPVIDTMKFHKEHQGFQDCNSSFKNLSC
ncbi:hypothetical protein HPP92_025937 [Vanilla planifolia]|uniref:Uncharacterized protein n=1 Tax=Vanilla planifolia TaxID=51239 RepID=A0A835PKZ8_VANPL|nr:hypothetical protein HPP92_025937 [Vanilla planifolia]